MSELPINSTTHKLGTALSVDFCPWANKWVYWLKNPFWILILAIAGSIVCGALLNPMIFAITALLLVVTLIGAGLPWLAIRWITCEVMFDVPRVRHGQPALVRLRIRNRSFLPVWGLSCIDGFAVSTEGNAAVDGSDGLAFGRVRGRSSIEYTWPFVAKHRGLYPVNESVRVETSFPFGLCRAQKETQVVGRLIVWPETVKVTGLPDSSECESAEDQFSDRRIGEFGDVMGTRQFRQGDSLKRVHWTQTARQQTLIVTERQSPVTKLARIVLDLSGSSHPQSHRVDTVEQCVRAAASICQSLHDQQCRVELQIGDDLIVGGQDAGGLKRLMDALAVAKVNNDAKGTVGTRPRSNRASRGFQLTITTPHGPGADDSRRLIITTADDPDTAGKAAWLTMSARAPLGELSRLWNGSL